MRKIAVLLTCFNRKEKTMEALEYMYNAFNSIENSISINVYLTDDGSTDGTGDAVRLKYPEIKVLPGNGHLYWAGGMRNSWNEALKNKYDAYLLLNDDTFTYDILFKELFETHNYCIETFGKTGIYIGSNINPKTKKLSYGGSVFTNKFLGKYVKLVPNNNTPQKCELGNANIMLVTKEVIEKIGILNSGFVHGLADFDYTMMAVKNKIPVLITPNYLGECLNENRNPYVDFHDLNLKKRIQVLKSPVGLDFKSNLLYNRRNFPFRYPIVFVVGWLKVLLPKVYSSLRFKI